jgi:uncharacterized protein YcbK (DUF882 family)
MRPIQLIGIVTLLFLSVIVTDTFPSDNTMDVSRYFYKGDGKLNLVNGKNKLSFNGTYRVGRGMYDEENLRAIHRIFGAGKDETHSTISLRLIEFLDFLEDRLHPGAQITIASGYRSPKYNTRLRNQGKLAATASLHQYGMAADIKMQGTPSKRIWNTVKNLGFGGTGYYHGKLVHIDVGPARSWDEKTSGVGTDISIHNKLIGLVTDYDIYLPGEIMELNFIRMTSFPIGVAPEFVLEGVEKNGRTKQITRFKASFASTAGSECPQFFDIDRMTGIHFQLPGDIPPGRYKIRASFCQRLWKDMPSEISTPEFAIVTP